MTTCARSAEDRQRALVGWLAAPFVGPLVPGVIWFMERGQRDSLARRECGRAAVVWMIVLLVWLPAFVLMLVVPMLQATPAEDNPAPLGVLWFALPLALIGALITVLGVVRVVRAPIRTGGPIGTDPQSQDDG